MAAYVGKVRVGPGDPVRVMAVLNLSPESFYSGSVVSPDKAVERAFELAEGGADIIDVGAMSTAPYRDAWVPPEKEAERLLPALKELAATLDVPITVDTYRPAIAEKALRLGAAGINDVTGLKLYPETCRVVRDHGASIVLMARERAPRPGVDPVARVVDALRESLYIALSCGVDEDRIVVDPGIGFPVLPPGDIPHTVTGEHRHGDPEWPWWRWDTYIIANLRRLGVLGRPILVGVSRKSFVRRIVGVPSPEEALHGSIAAEAIAVLMGAHAVRTHNPRETLQAVRMAEAVRGFTSVDHPLP